MALSIGIIGLPNVGKSTLFNALLKKQAALAANYPFATIEPNVGVVDVPDERLQKLYEIVEIEYKTPPKRIVPAVVNFVDIAGLVKGASEGEGLGNKFLSHIREVDAIIHVVRSFEDPNVARAGSTDPESDISVINTELILADIQVLSKRIENEQRNSKSGDKVSFERLSVYEKLMIKLDQGELASATDLTEKEKLLAKDLNLLTAKPFIHVYNVSEEFVTKPDNKETGTDVVYLCAQLESELASLSDQEAEEYMKELGIHNSGLDKVIKRGYKLLNLHTFFTAGPKEVRAWTIGVGDKAPQAAGTIHTDFERGFICAEVISFDGLVKAGGWKKAKDLGLIRTEGKEYIMKDGDVVEFRFSV
jgi:GTP-binding protein YchF